MDPIKDMWLLWHLQWKNWPNWRRELRLRLLIWSTESLPSVSFLFSWHFIARTLTFTAVFDKKSIRKKKNSGHLYTPKCLCTFSEERSIKYSSAIHFFLSFLRVFNYCLSMFYPLIFFSSSSIFNCVNSNGNF